MNIFLSRRKRTDSGRGGVRSAFTILELVVVIAIMVTMLALATNMLRNSGRGQGLQNSMQMVEGTIQETQLEAKNRGTWARFVIISDPSDTKPNGDHLRTYGIMVYNQTTKKWELVSRLSTLPPDFYISPKYSTPLESVASSKTSAKGKGSRRNGGAFNSREGKDTVYIPSYRRNVDVYFIEFDEEGRLSQPNNATRLVIVGGAASKDGDDDNMRPSSMDGHRPRVAAGIAIYPKGHISKLRTPEQIVP